MKIKKINFGKYCGKSMVRPFRPDLCRLEFCRYYHPEDDPRRKHVEKVVVKMDLTPEEVVCAIQHLRRWLKDRVVDAEVDFERGGKYRSSDHSMIYHPPED